MIGSNRKTKDHINPPYGEFKRMNNIPLYLPISHSGCGLFGNVVKSIKSDGSYVAIKTIRDTGTGIRWCAIWELQSLYLLRRNKHILNINDVVLKIRDRNVNVSIVTPHYQCDLWGFIKSYPNSIREHLFPSVLQQILYMLSVLRHYGILHGEIKPPNIMVNYSNDNIHCVLGDFGTSKRLNNCIGHSLYAPGYKPPEMSAIPPTIGLEGDVWAAGITMEVYIEKGTICREDRVILNSMLAISPKDRYVPLPLLNPIDQPRSLQRGPIHQDTKIDIDDCLSKMLLIWFSLEVKIETLICSLDIFSRYLHNFRVDNSTIRQVIIACISIATKAVEIEDIDPDIDSECVQMEAEILVKFNYIMISTEYWCLLRYVSTLHNSIQWLAVMCSYKFDRSYEDMVKLLH